MPERDGFRTFGDLVVAIGEDWFASTLRGALQALFHHDYTLIAHYRRGSSLRVLQSNLDGAEARRAIGWLERETFVAEPIFRLFAARSAPAGVHDMAELAVRAAALPPAAVAPDRLPHLVADPNEEIGWRTMGWPRHQQETCLLVPIGDDDLLAISLYNAGAARAGIQSDRRLIHAWPLLGAIIVRHCDTDAGRRWRTPEHGYESADLERASASRLAPERVSRFFHEAFDIDLTARERDVFSHLLQGETLPGTAQALGVSLHTARTHRRNVYRRLGRGRLPELINDFHRYSAVR